LPNSLEILLIANSKLEKYFDDVIRKNKSQISSNYFRNNLFNGIIKQKKYRNYTFVSNVNYKFVSNMNYISHDFKILFK
jgi:hypothetical protein